jgi:hypothetical protein
VSTDRKTPVERPLARPLERPSRRYPANRPQLTQAQKGWMQMVIGEVLDECEHLALDEAADRDELETVLCRRLGIDK